MGNTAGSKRDVAVDRLFCRLRQHARWPEWFCQPGSDGWRTASLGAEAYFGRIAAWSPELQASIRNSHTYRFGRDRPLARLCFGDRDDTRSRRSNRLRLRLGHLASLSSQHADHESSPAGRRVDWIRKNAERVWCRARVGRIFSDLLYAPGFGRSGNSRDRAMGLAGTRPLQHEG